MPDLIAQGPEPQDRWRRRLPGGQRVVLGREAGSWSAPWDTRISRQHVGLCWENRYLEVQKLPEARNPVFFRGQPQGRFLVQPGEHFVIGGTTFTLADEKAQVSLDVPEPVTEAAYSPLLLQQHRFRDADQRIAVLSRLPEIISGATSDTELFVRLVNVLLAGIPRAASVAVVAVHPEQSLVNVLHWDRRSLAAGTDFAPSERLIRQSVERRESVVHVWSDPARRGGSSFTQRENVDWAFCTPVTGAACRGWALYVAGQFDLDSAGEAFHPDELRDDLKFAEVAATTLSSLRELRLLERKHASLSQFFSPVVLEALAGQDPDEVLAPREADVTVLFCDLRGFSRKSERSAHDLRGLLHRVSIALGVMTHHILEQGGVVGDFHGDAAMGFWGWPLPQQDAVERACRAALGVRAEFEAAAHEGHPLADFRVGIGIASGRAVAGKIGTVDQVKVTVFGPVVNLASRLQDATKVLRAPILLDEPSARRVRQRLPASEARIRRVAPIRPYGLDTALEVSELLPPESQHPQLTDSHLAAYEAALDALLARDWTEAFSLLHHVPPEDRVKDFLTVFIAQHNRTPPEHWDGVIPITSK